MRLITRQLLGVKFHFSFKKRQQQDKQNTRVFTNISWQTKATESSSLCLYANDCFFLYFSSSFLFLIFPVIVKFGIGKTNIYAAMIKAGFTWAFPSHQSQHRWVVCQSASDAINCDGSNWSSGESRQSTLAAAAKQAARHNLIITLVIIIIMKLFVGFWTPLWRAICLITLEKKKTKVNTTLIS